jgi:hypothetical protein
MRTGRNIATTKTVENLMTGEGAYSLCGTKCNTERERAIERVGDDYYYASQCVNDFLNSSVPLMTETNDVRGTRNRHFMLPTSPSTRAIIPGKKSLGLEELPTS